MASSLFRYYALFFPMVRINGHLPANSALTLRVLVVILRRKLALLFTDDLSPAAQAGEDAGMIRRIAGLVFLIKSTVVTFSEPAKILVESHVGFRLCWR